MTRLRDPGENEHWMKLCVCVLEKLSPRWAYYHIYYLEKDKDNEAVTGGPLTHLLYKPEVWDFLVTVYHQQLF